ncbi:MAG: hypothetical protein AAFN93_00950 [Bacteroidota bacterium]
MNKKFSIKALLAALTVMVFSQCSNDNYLEDPIADAIGLEVYSNSQVSGSATYNGKNISYVSKTTDGNNYKVQIGIGDHLLEATINYGTEQMLLDGHSAVLSVDEKNILSTAGRDIYEYVNKTEGDVNYAEYSLVRLMEYWSKAPSNFVYSARAIGNASASIQGRLGNEGVTCIRKNTYVYAEYDDSRGTHKDRVRVGSKPRSGYGCMGRCGGDCGWGAPSAWTKDCMDHDQCSNINFSSGGSGDSNCGDEFNEAADDWLFGVIRGCRG